MGVNADSVLDDSAHVQQPSISVSRPCSCPPLSRCRGKVQACRGICKDNSFPSFRLAGLEEQYSQDCVTGRISFSFFQQLQNQYCGFAYCFRYCCRADKSLSSPHAWKQRPASENITSVRASRLAVFPNRKSPIVSPKEWWTDSLVAPVFRFLLTKKLYENMGLHIQLDKSNSTCVDFGFGCLVFSEMSIFLSLPGGIYEFLLLSKTLHGTLVTGSVTLFVIWKTFRRSHPRFHVNQQETATRAPVDLTLHI